jgi:hypothetical protein
LEDVLQPYQISAERDGSKIRFWDDVWCGEMTLKEAYPDLYSIACVKDASVAVHLDFSSGSLQ